jgi:hypothetical protein
MVKRREKGHHPPIYKLEGIRNTIPSQVISSVEGGGWQRRERKPSTDLKLESVSNISRTNLRGKKNQEEKMFYFGL